MIAATNLPDGVGKDLVEGLCTGCHSANQMVRSSGYTEEEWAEHFSNMVDLADMPKERSEIAQYLAANMPPDTTRAPTLVPGELEVGFPSLSSARYRYAHLPRTLT